MKGVSPVLIRVPCQCTNGSLLLDRLICVFTLSNMLLLSFETETPEVRNDYHAGWVL